MADRLIRCDYGGLEPSCAGDGRWQTRWQMRDGRWRWEMGDEEEKRSEREDSEEFRGERGVEKTETI
jgi:hypothetical protein